MAAALCGKDLRLGNQHAEEDRQGRQRSELSEWGEHAVLSARLSAPGNRLGSSGALDDGTTTTDGVMLQSHDGLGQPGGARRPCYRSPRPPMSHTGPCP